MTTYFIRRELVLNVLSSDKERFDNCPFKLVLEPLIPRIIVDNFL